MTPAEYEKALTRIRRHNPTEPLLSTLAKGYSAVNVLYIKVCLKRLPLPVPVTKSAKQEVLVIVQNENENENETSSDNDTLRMLTRKIAAAYTNIRKTRNDFHKCTTQADYARVSDEVQRVWEKEVRYYIDRRAHYLNTGQLDESAPEALPETGAALVKHINSLRARISQARKAGKTDRIEQLQRMLEAANEKLETIENA